MTDDALPLVIVGGGAAGMIAAINASISGQPAIILEKNVRVGCNAEFSGGLIQGSGTRFQEQAGVTDSPEQHFADLQRQNRGESDPAIVELVARRSADAVHLLADEAGLALHLDQSVLYSGHSTYRMHSMASETGQELVQGIRARIRNDENIDFVDNAEVTDIVPNGSSLDVLVSMSGQQEVIPARNVILASNGFGANREMVRKYIGEAIAALPYWGSENSDGRGILIGMGLGAGTAYMTAYEGHSHLNPKYGTRMGGALPALGSILVDASGRRFASEATTNSGFSKFMIPLPGSQAVEIYDERIHRAAMTNGAYEEASEMGAVKQFEDLETLAAAFDLPVDAVADEVRKYNAAAGSERDELDRAARGRIPFAPPYYAASVSAGVIHTQGGLTVDTSCRVLTTNAEVIPGLYATGGVAAGISGTGVDTYLPGNGLTHAFTTGLVASEHVASVLV
ncbi:FAD-dependent oxidoreductase [Gulosibacter chungangensis]|uniref:FAD-binding protein n=1 Tax=Gulosibacter chungangensis TaxID=979746 RepID=A0A7J5BHL0_9MICO|nr:FAD-binding protein [Gulosibacter chungangensis]KAB1645110.1 FAD-binding protein [Gulosibacter chungangensis]